MKECQKYNCWASDQEVREGYCAGCPFEETRKLAIINNEALKKLQDKAAAERKKKSE